MIKNLGHAGTHRRVAVNVGAGFVPGMNSVLMGAALAGGRLGWEMVGIRDGFEGLLHPDRYPDKGLVALTPELVENLDPATGGVLGQAPRVDPFQAPAPDGKTVDLSDEVLQRLQAENIDGLVSAVGVEGLEVLYKLHRKGLHTVCIPRSIENNIAGTALSFGFNSALSTTIEMLNKAYQAARSARKTAVVEVPGEVAGWIAMQAGIAARADAVLMPEIPCHLRNLAARLKDKLSARRPYGLVVVAEGAQVFDDPPQQPGGPPTMDEANPIVTGPGRAAETVARLLQPRIAADVHPLVIGSWARGGNPTAVDQQLGMAFGAATVQALKSGQNGLMVAFVPPEMRLVPLAEAVGKVRTVPNDSGFMRIAQSLGIYLGTGL
jgi:ATP-dependent phosphofructokinase / diphosphate-dependent phosphofructokinase